MSSRPAAALLDDILDALSKIRSYAAELSRDEFLADSKTQDAVIRNLEIVGEATSRLPDEVRQSCHTIDWRSIIGLRHRMIHGYFGVDAEIIWYIVTHDLNDLQIGIQSARTNLDPPETE